MTPNIKVDYKSSIRDSLKIIEKNSYGICFVVKSNKVLGTVTDGDIRRALLKNVNLNKNVETITNKNFSFVKENYDYLEIQEKIKKFKIIPIISNKGLLLDFASSRRLGQIPQSEPSLKKNELKYVVEAINSGWVSSRGRFINEFEKSFAKKFKFKYCLLTSNGTTAIHLALSTMNLKKDDEVIVPNFTFVSPINSIILANAKPILADVEYNTCCIDVNKIKRLINKKTKAIIAVHLYGHSANIIELKKICKKNNLILIEDCAEALGTYVKSKHVGNFGDFGTFSFFANKTITTGEGGMLVFKNKKDYLNAKSLRDHGMSTTKRYWHNKIGFNYRMTNVQAAIGLGQLENFDYFLKKKIHIFKFYKKNLNSNEYFDLSKDSLGVKNSYWLVYLKLKNFKKIEKIRNKLISYLKINGVDGRTGFFAASLMPIYKKYKSDKTTYEKSIILSKNMITLPSFVNLNDYEIAYVCKLINNFFKKQNSIN